jgi:hypothetical protein
MSGIETADVSEGPCEAAPHRPPAEPAKSGRASEIMDRRAEQRIRAGVALMVQHEDVHVVSGREPLDQPQQRRDHTFATGPIHAAGEHEADPHIRVNEPGPTW